MPSEREIEAAAKMLSRYNDAEWENCLQKTFYLTEARAALEAAERVREEWQPISPKDGTPILPYIPKS